MRTTVLLSALALAGMASAQVFTSDLETWNAGAPAGWLGARSNIGASNVTQVTDNPHGGSSAVRLVNTTSSHKRFTTETVEVTDGTSYTVSFWVRGTGQIRVGLFDGRPGGTSGYAPYSAYTTVSSADTWTQVTRSVVANNDTTGAEFILSVVSTTAPENIVVDDVNITEGAALVPVTIFAIQNTTDASGDSPLNGQTVLTGGIVTAAFNDTSGYFIQNNTGAWQGVFVYDLDHAVTIGDSVTFIATVDEFNNNTELTGIANFNLVSSGNTVPAPLNVQTGDVPLEALESVLVHLTNAACTLAPSGATFGKYNVSDGSGDAVIGKVIYTTTPNPTVGQHLDITGVNYYSFAEYNVEPRMTSDVQLATGIADAGVLGTVSVGPNPATDVLNINLGQAAGQRVKYTITDAQGRMVQSGVLTNERSTLSMNGMANGLYHFTLLSNQLVKSFAVQVLR